MSILFKGSEILQLAIEIEKNGQSFYQQAIEKTPDKEVQQVFRYLAEEEKKHQQKFQQMLETIGEFQPAESYPGEYLSYLKTLAEENVFTREGAGKEVLRGVSREQEAINLGIGFEKDSILFFQEMMRLVPRKEQITVKELLNQEKAHLQKLWQLKAKIS